MIFYLIRLDWQTLFMKFYSRNPGIDVLRAVAMLLGIFLHGSIPYKLFPQRNWIHDNNTSIIFDFIYFFVHSFRMPVFFIIAGFFCNHLLRKYPIKAFIKNRIIRVGIPFIFGSLIIVPFTLFPYAINNMIQNKGYVFSEAVEQSYPTFLSFKGLAHLWFLYDLLIFYTFVLILKKLTFFIPFYKRFQTFFNILFIEKYALLLVSLPVWICLLPNEDLYLITDTFLIPRRPLNLLIFGYLFALGYLLYSSKTIHENICSNYKKYLITSLSLLLLLFFYHVYIQNHEKNNIWYLMKYLVSLQVLFGSFGLIGLFMSEIKQESYYVRYIADASYWIYIIHLAIILYLQVFLTTLDISSFIKYFIVVSVTAFISIVSDGLLIRYSIIGGVLHGPKKRK